MQVIGQPPLPARTKGVRLPDYPPSRPQAAAPSRLHRYHKHSVAALLLHGCKDVVVTARPLSSTLDLIGGAGAGLLGVISMGRLVRAQKTDQRLDAASSLAWGLQASVLTARSLIPTASHGSLGATAAALGVAGAGLQVLLGTRQLAEGLGQGKHTHQVLGSINLAAGTCWALSALSIAAPLTSGAFIALTLAGSAYEHQLALRWAGRRVARRLHLMSPQAPALTRSRDALDPRSRPIGAHPPG